MATIDHNAEAAADIVVRDLGTIWTFTAQTEAAEAFLGELGTESWQWLGRTALGVDHRPASHLLDHICADTGLTTYLI